MKLGVECKGCGFAYKQPTMHTYLADYAAIVYCLLFIVYCYRKASAKAEGDDTKENVFSHDPWASPQGITPYLPIVPVADIPETYGLSR